MKADGELKINPSNRNKIELWNYARDKQLQGVRKPLNLIISFNRELWLRKFVAANKIWLLRQSLRNKTEMACVFSSTKLIFFLSVHRFVGGSSKKFEIIMEDDNPRKALAAVFCFMQIWLTSNWCCLKWSNCRIMFYATIFVQNIVLKPDCADLPWFMCFSVTSFLSVLII